MSGAGGRDDDGAGAGPGDAEYVDLSEAKKARAPAKKVAANIVARAVMEKVRLLADQSGTVYLWNSKHWAEIKPWPLKKLILDEAGEDCRRDFRNEALDYIQAAACDPLLAWGRVAPHEIAAGNGVVDVRTWKMRPHVPEDRLERAIPWAWCRGAECPAWQGALIDWFGDDDSGAELIAALQEFFGYACMAHARFKKALLLYGPGDTGKSQVAYALQDLVGIEYTCQLPVDQMDDPEARAVLKGKALNIMTELPAEAMIRDGGFKTLVATEEPVLLNEKYKPRELYLPTAKHAIATNTLPRITDRTDATYNRLLLIPMEKPIAKDRQDRNLRDALRAEMEGIFAWAVEGAARLIARGGEWPVPERSAVLLGEYRAEQNPLVQFLAECGTKDDGEAVALSQVTRLYNEWNKGGRKIDTRMVGRALRDAGCEIKKARFARDRVLMGLIGWRLELPTTNDLMSNPDDGGGGASASSGGP